MSIKLHYFQIRGTVEVTRLLLADAGASFQNVPLALSDLEENKELYEFGRAPVLEDADGAKVSLPGAIMRYVAAKFGKAGKNAAESARIDSLIELASEIRDAYVKLIYDDEFGDEEKKEEVIGRYFEERFNSRLAQLEGLLQSNNEGTGYFVGGDASAADVFVFDLLDNLTRLRENCLEEYPLLSGLKTRVAERENIAAYLTSDKRYTAVNGNQRG